MEMDRRRPSFPMEFENEAYHVISNHSSMSHPIQALSMAYRTALDHSHSLNRSNFSLTGEIACH